MNGCRVSERMPRELRYGSSPDLWVSTHPDSILRPRCYRESVHLAPRPLQSLCPPQSVLVLYRQKGVTLLESPQL